MKPPQPNAYVSLIGTILIMWLMVGYVYVLTPLDSLPSPSAAQAAAGDLSFPGTVDTVHAPAVGGLPSHAYAGDAELTLLLPKRRYLSRETVEVVARLSGLPETVSDATLSSLLIEGDIQVLGPVMFTPGPQAGEYVSRIRLNPATGQPLPGGSYRVVVRVGVDLVAAVPFDVDAVAEQLAWQGLSTQ